MISKLQLSKSAVADFLLAAQLLPPQLQLSNLIIKSEIATFGVFKKKSKKKKVLSLKIIPHSALF